MHRTPGRSRRFAAVSLLAAAAAVGAVFAGPGSSTTGPSSSQSPYIVGTLPGVTFTSILTVGDSVNNKPDGSPYRMVGIPDGLGAFDNCDGTFTVLMNHELTETSGIVRAHGARGAFVSRWIVDKRTLEVEHGEDLIQDVAVWTGTEWDDSTTVTISRLCSADLPEVSAFYDARKRKGYAGRLFMSGEERGSEGLAFAHAMDGTSYALPWLGRFSWENCVANPSTGLATVVVGIDDDVAGQVYVYVGEKQRSGETPPDQAGLTHGVLFGIKVDGIATEPATGIPSGTAFTAFPFGDVATTTGVELQNRSRSNLVTEFNRPEDGHWDPENPEDFYFVTTASFTGPSRLWRLSFLDPAKPWLGGTIDMLLDGTEGQKMLDNMTVTERGQVVLQEDPGGQTHLAKIWRYDIRTDTLVQLAQHDPARFTVGAPGFLTIDEESSGVIDVSDILGEGKFLVDVQAHYNANDTELVQGGQLLLMHVPSAKKGKKGGKGDKDDDDDDDKHGRD